MGPRRFTAASAGAECRAGVTDRSVAESPSHRAASQANCSRSGACGCCSRQSGTSEGSIQDRTARSRWRRAWQAAQRVIRSESWWQPGRRSWSRPVPVRPTAATAAAIAVENRLAIINRKAGLALAPVAPGSGFANKASGLRSFRESNSQNPDHIPEVWGDDHSPQPVGPSPMNQKLVGRRMAPCTYLACLRWRRLCLGANSRTLRRQ